MSVLVLLSVYPVLFLPLERRCFPCFDKATAEEEDVAVLELDVTLLSDLLDLVQRNRMATHTVRIVLQTLPLAIRDIVDKDSTGSDTILSPVTDTDTIALFIRDLVRGRAAVPFARAVPHIGAEVAKSIPLRRGLRIEAPDVVPSDPFIVRYGHNLMLARESIETCASKC